MDFSETIAAYDLKLIALMKICVSRFCMFCAYTRPRYQVSVYRTIGPVVA